MPDMRNYDNNYKKHFKYLKKNIRLSDRDLHMLKKHKRMEGYDFTIEIMDNNMSNLRFYGKKKQ